MCKKVRGAIDTAKFDSAVSMTKSGVASAKITVTSAGTTKKGRVTPTSDSIPNDIIPSDINSNDVIPNYIIPNRIPNAT